MVLAAPAASLSLSAVVCGRPVPAVRVALPAAREQLQGNSEPGSIRLAGSESAEEAVGVRRTWFRLVGSSAGGASSLGKPG